VHVPAVIKVAVVPLTAQTPVVCDAKLTARPELAAADSASGVPTVCVLGALKVIDCGLKVSVTVAVPDLPEALALIVTLGEEGMVAGAVNKPAALI
jgi:hypothetical protein